MRLGVLGGTFDPIHLGHLLLAEETRQRLGLEKVLFVPAGQPYMRPAHPIATARDRFAMAELAVQGNPAFEASRIEVDRPGPTYSVDTLQELHMRYGLGTEIFFILGQDAFLELPGWKSPEKLVTLCTLAVVPRPGAAPLKAGGEWSFGSVHAKVTVLGSPLIGISSTEVRRRISTGTSVRYWVPTSVEQYIKTHRLYGAARPT